MLRRRYGTYTIDGRAEVFLDLVGGEAARGSSFKLAASLQRAESVVLLGWGPRWFGFAFGRCCVVVLISRLIRLLVRRVEVGRDGVLFGVWGYDGDVLHRVAGHGGAGVGGHGVSAGGLVDAVLRAEV